MPLRTTIITTIIIMGVVDITVVVAGTTMDIAEAGINGCCRMGC